MYFSEITFPTSFGFSSTKVQHPRLSHSSLIWSTHCFLSLHITFLQSSQKLSLSCILFVTLPPIFSLGLSQSVSSPSILIFKLMRLPLQFSNANTNCLLSILFLLHPSNSFHSQTFLSFTSLTASSKNKLNIKISSFIHVLFLVSPQSIHLHFF